MVNFLTDGVSGVGAGHGARVECAENTAEVCPVTNWRGLYLKKHGMIPASSRRESFAQPPAGSQVVFPQGDMIQAEPA